MVSYRINEAEFNVPADWQDQSLIAFKIPATNGTKDASFVITRDFTRKQSRFAEHIDTQLKMFDKQLPEFRLKKNESFQFQDHAGVWLEYEWTQGAARLAIRQVFYDRQDYALICTLTTLPEDVSAIDPIWRTVMSRMKLLPLADASESAPSFPPRTMP